MFVSGQITVAHIEFIIIKASSFINSSHWSSCINFIIVGIIIIKHPFKQNFDQSIAAGQKKL